MAGSLAYQKAVDIANRALQHCRKRRVNSISPPDQSQQAQEVSFVYDKLREAELQCNLWRFATKRVILRPIETGTVTIATSADTPSGLVLPFTATTGATTGPVFSSNGAIASNTLVSSFTSTAATLNTAITGDIPSGTAITFGPQTLLWTPPTYNAGTTYAIGAVVVDGNGEWWQSKVGSNTGNTPVPGASWLHYTGVDYLMPWNTQLTYFTGELVLGSDSNVYMNLVTPNGNGTAGNDPTLTTGFWLLVGGTTAPLTFYYPIGTGPASSTTTANAFRLPHGFLRQAPSDPKSASNVWLGAPHGNRREDWVFEDDYLISAAMDPIMLRYIQNTVDVPTFSPMFCEMLAARIAEEVAPQLSDAETLPLILSNVARHYKTERWKAITVNGIEIGPVDPDLDDYITARY